LSKAVDRPLSAGARGLRECREAGAWRVGKRGGFARTFRLRGIAKLARNRFTRCPDSRPTSPPWGPTRATAACRMSQLSPKPWHSMSVVRRIRPTTSSWHTKLITAFGSRAFLDADARGGL